MQALLLNLPVQLPLVIVDLIIEYKNQVEYAERVWKMYSLNFWQHSKDRYYVPAYFGPVFRNVYYSDCFDEDKMEKAVIEYGKEENLWTEEQFDEIKQHLWDLGTEEKFEGKNFWFLKKFSPN